MNEVEKYMINNFRLANKDKEDYSYLTDEEILKVNPVTADDYIEYYDYLALLEEQNIKSCLICIQNLENEPNSDYIRRKEKMEYIKEETEAIIRSQTKISEYRKKINEYLKQTNKEHIR